MKKGVKIALWTAGICMVSGLLLTKIGMAAGGEEDLAYTGAPKLTPPQVTAPKIVNGKVVMPEVTFDGLDGEGGIYNGKKEDEAYPVYNGNFETEIPYEGSLQRLEVEIGVHGLEISEKAGDTISLVGENCDRIQCYVKNGTLFVRDVGSYKRHLQSNGRRLLLTIPADICWEDADLEASMGSVEMDSLQTKNTEISAGMGSVEVAKCTAEVLEADADIGSIILGQAEVNHAEFEVNMGSVEFEGSISGDVSASADMGSISLELEQAETDFDYELSASMGSVILDGTEYAGLDREKSIANGASQKMELDSSMGSIEISFK